MFDCASSRQNSRSHNWPCPYKCHMCDSLLILIVPDESLNPCSVDQTRWKSLVTFANFLENVQIKYLSYFFIFNENHDLHAEKPSKRKVVYSVLRSAFFSSNLLCSKSVAMTSYSLYNQTKLTTTVTAYFLP